MAREAAEAAAVTAANAVEALLASSDNLPLRSRAELRAKLTELRGAISDGELRGNLPDLIDALRVVDFHSLAAEALRATGAAGLRRYGAGQHLLVRRPLHGLDTSSEGAALGAASEGAAPGAACGGAAPSAALRAAPSAASGGAAPSAALRAVPAVAAHPPSSSAVPAVAAHPPSSSSYEWVAVQVIDADVLGTHLLCMLDEPRDELTSEIWMRLHPWNHVPRQLPAVAYEALREWYAELMASDGVGLRRIASDCFGYGFGYGFGCLWMASDCVGLRRIASDMASDAFGWLPLIWEYSSLMIIMIATLSINHCPSWPPALLGTFAPSPSTTCTCSTL